MHGRSKPSCYDLPSQQHTFGMPLHQDPGKRSGSPTDGRG